MASVPILNDHSKLALLQAGLDHIDQGISIFDDQLRLVFWNRRYFDLLDFPISMAAVGTPFSAFIRYNAERGEYGPDKTDVLVDQRVRLAREFVVHYFERSRPNGVLLAIHGVPLNEGGFITVYTDITEQRRNEQLIQERNEHLEARVLRRTEELRATNQELLKHIEAEKRIAASLQHSEARLQLIIDAVPAGIAFVDADGRYQFANRRMARAFGLSKDEIIGRSTDDIVGAGILQRLTPHMDQVREGQQVTLEYETDLPGGRHAQVRTMVIPQLGDHGQIQGYYILSLDVSDQKKAESALLQAQKMESVAELAGGLAHDFNNLLTVVLGNLVPLQDRHLESQEDLALLNPAIEAARRGANLIGRLLSFSRQHPLKPVPVDVEGLIENLVDLLRGSLPNNIAIANLSDSDRVMASVDPHQLENALLNLAFNARDAMPDGGDLMISTCPYRIEAEGDPAVELPPGDYVRIRVADNGSGIDGETLKRVFEPFFTTKKVGRGSGLGLSTVYGFARQSNGAVQIESAPSEGTVVSLFLPAAEEDVGLDGIDPKAPVGLRESGEMVLLVDDDRDVRAVIRRQLSELGYTLIEAPNGDQALELLTNVPGISILLSDVVMPGKLNGFDLAKLARARWPDLKIVLMSAQRSDREAPDAIRGRLPILSKPFEKAELERVLNRSRGPAIAY